MSNHDYRVAMYRRGSVEPIIFGEGDEIPADLVDVPGLPPLTDVNTARPEPDSVDPASSPAQGAGDGPAQPSAPVEAPAKPKAVRSRK